MKHHNVIRAMRTISLIVTLALIGMMLPGGEAHAVVESATTWTPTGVYTGSVGLALVEAAGILYAFQRSSGTDTRLQVTMTNYNTKSGSSTSTVAGSPAITSDAVSAAYDPGTGKVFVAVRTKSSRVTTGGRVMVAEGTATNAGLSSWTWHDLGYTDGSPAVVVACNRVHVAVRADDWIWTIWRPVSGGAWSALSRLDFGASLPSLAVNSRVEVGLTWRGHDTNVYFRKMACDTSTNPAFAAAVFVGDKLTNNDRVSLTAYGRYFAAAIRATDGYPYFILQTPDGAGNPTWPASFERVDSLLGVAEPPVAFTYRGLFFLAARDATNAVYYWIRNPNTLANRALLRMWTVARSVSGGFGRTPVAMATAGTTNLQGGFGRFDDQSGVPSELFVAIRGMDDQIWALNLSRFATLDVLEGFYQMTVNTSQVFYVDKKYITPGTGIPNNTVPNLFENLQAFLRTPSKYWNSLSDVTKGGGCVTGDRKGVTIYPNLLNDKEWVDGNCGSKPPIASGVVIDGDNGTAWRIWEEWGHEVLGMNRSMQDSTWHDAFDGLSPKGCSTNANCDKYNYCLAAKNAGPWTSSRAGGADKKVCMSLDSSPNRPSGFVDDYSLSSNEHNWIDMVIMYRWFGEDLRRIAREDAASGDGRLGSKYTWIRTNVFSGVEFNGARGNASAVGDETRGGFAMPMN